MGILGTILGKLGLGKDETPPPAVTPTTSAALAPPAAPTPIAVVDVVADLTKRAAANPQKLNWETSIVDLLKLLEMDSSLTARKELANEMGCPLQLREDSAQMNMWLHKTVLERIAYNGGNIPAHLID
ncbi:MAG: DUF3597 domain-containing protein [Gemmatimonadales bacterium]|nr:DUF3597 domain-containing protein [Gemmatimonadales bacterium]